MTKKSGAIVFDDWEWHLIDKENELKILFNEEVNGGYLYSLNTDTSRILRRGGYILLFFG